MTATPDNLLSNLPPGLDEVDLLAWIEGDTLPRNREVAVARLLSEHPALARRLDAIRRDREVLRSIPSDEVAPAGLMDGVQNALMPLMERQMLLGLQEGESVDGRPPVSLVMPPRRPIRDGILGTTGRRFAMAAGLLLLVGGGTYLATSIYMRGTSPLPSQQFAIGDSLIDSPARGLLQSEADESFAVAAAESEAATTQRKLEPGLESELAIAAADDHTEAQGDDEVALALRESSSIVDSASDLATDTKEASMSLAHAVRLAQEGRLVIRMHMGDGFSRLERERLVVDRLRRGSTGWRYSGEAPQALATAVTLPVFFHDPVPVRSPERFLAGNDRPLPPGAEYGPPAPRPIIELPALRTDVFLVQSRLDSAAIESLITSLVGIATEVILEEAPERLPIIGEQAHSLSPSAVLWWGQPPSAWTWWTSLPVVVEPRR